MLRRLAPRIGVGIAFLSLGAVLLGLAGKPVFPVPETPPEAPSHAYLIVTNEDLFPAFDALASWIREEGGAALVLTLERLRATSLPLLAPGGEVAYLGSVCMYLGYSGLIVAGEEAVREVKPGSLAEGSRLALVRTLDEAWVFVDRCRRGSLPLDPVLFEVPVALVIEEPAPLPLEVLPPVATVLAGGAVPPRP